MAAQNILSAKDYKLSLVKWYILEVKGYSLEQKTIQSGRSEYN